MRQLPMLALALAACGMQRTGGEDSIPTVNAIYVQADAQIVAYTGGECPVADAAKKWRRGDRFNPMLECDR